MKTETEVVDAEIVDPTTTAEPAVETEAVEDRPIRNSIKTMLAALSAAVNSGEMKGSQAAEIRRRFGISKRHFTKRKFNFAKTKRRRQLAALSRKANRGTGKGEKRTGGIA